MCLLLRDMKKYTKKEVEHKKFKRTTKKDSNLQEQDLAHNYKKA